SVLLLLTVGSACMLVSVHAKTPLRGVVGGYLYTLGCLGLATIPCFQIGNPFIFLLFISAGEWVYWWLIPFCVIHLLIVRSCLRRAIGQLRTAALAPPGVPLDAFERMLKSEIIRRVPPPAARQTSPGWGPFPAEEPGTAPGRRREPLDFRPARECRSVGEHA